MGRFVLCAGGLSQTGMMGGVLLYLDVKGVEMSSSQLNDGSEADYSRYKNPMQVLAEALKVDYPVPVSDRWVRVLLALLPCTVLVVVSFLWPPASTLLLTFVGAVRQHSASETISARFASADGLSVRGAGGSKIPS